MVAHRFRRFGNRFFHPNEPMDELLAPPSIVPPSNQFAQPANRPVASLQSPTLYNSVSGQTFNIVGHVGGRIVAVWSGNVPTGAIITSHNEPSTRFVVEASPVEGSEHMVTFRIDGTRFYLTQNPFGNIARAHLLETLIYAESLPFPGEVLHEITEFAVGTGTQEGHFEGAGFDYTPMYAIQLQRQPGILQSFVVESVGERCTGLNHIGIRSPFGKYWRSQHWDHTVTQSPHCLRDETWRLLVAAPHP